MINIIVSIFDRCMTNSRLQPRLGIVELSGQRNATILHLLSLDLRAVANNILKDGYTIIDKDMNHPVNDEALEILTGTDFGQSLIEFYTLLRRQLPLNLISNSYHSQFFIGLSKDRCEYIDILKDYFLDHRLKEDIGIYDKVIEDSEQQQRFKAYLQEII